MKCLDHNHITKIYSSFETPSKKIVTIMEICDSDLEKELRNRISPFSDEHVLRWSAQLISAMAYLAKMNVIHRDLKPAVSVSFFVFVHFHAFVSEYLDF